MLFDYQQCTVYYITVDLLFKKKDAEFSWIKEAKKQTFIGEARIVLLKFLSITLGNKRK